MPILRRLLATVVVGGIKVWERIAGAPFAGGTGIDPEEIEADLSKVVLSGPDQDLRYRSRDELLEQLVRYRAAIRAHRDASGHNLCWFVPELWDLLPDRITPTPAVPPQAEFLKCCELYRKSLDGPFAPPRNQDELKEHFAKLCRENGLDPDDREYASPTLLAWLFFNIGVSFMGWPETK